jgi:sterol desaturase/sphingolipid hydroxylase (fatty acid hydroxylase superfamily)
MPILARLEYHALPLAYDFVRLCVWLLLLILIFAPLERIFAVHPQKVFRKSFLTDLAYYFLNSFLTRLLLVLPMALLAWLLHFLVPAGLHALVAALPLGWRFAASLIVGEIGFYWGHRWTHEIPFLWRFHAIHHSAEEMDWLVNTRAHPADMVFTRLCGFIPMYLTGLTQPVGRTLDVVPLLVIVTGIVWGFFIHSNLRWRLGPIEWLIATPAFHHWHHTFNEPINKNYSSMLPWMDCIFGTYYMPRKWPARYGTATPVAPGLAAQLLDPLLPAPAASVPALSAQRDS